MNDTSRAVVFVITIGLLLIIYGMTLVNTFRIGDIRGDVRAICEVVECGDE